MNDDINAMIDQVAASAWSATKSDVEKIEDAVARYVKEHSDGDRDIPQKITDIIGFNNEVFLVSLKVGLLCGNCDELHWRPGRALCIRRGDDFEALEPDDTQLLSKSDEEAPDEEVPGFTVSVTPQGIKVSIARRADLPTMDINDPQFVHEDGTPVARDVPAWQRQPEPAVAFDEASDEPHKAPGFWARIRAWLRWPWKRGER